MHSPACESDRGEPRSGAGSIGTFSVESLRHPSAYPHVVERVAVLETLLSWVFLTGQYAYKVKKPVKLDYIDASTLSRREYLCCEELRLNRRTAPELYVDVVPICLAPDGLKVCGNGEPIEFAVRMRQFPQDQLLRQLLLASAVDPTELAEFGRSLATFHERAAVAVFADGETYLARVRRTVLGNLASLLAYDRDVETLPALGALNDWVHQALAASEPHVHAREVASRVRDCHGDLHARNIVRFQGRLTPFDCLEFDRELREIDVMSDVAFLLMDLLGHGRRDLAFSFLDAYLDASGDYDGVQLLPLHLVHRALVRARVDALEACAPGADRGELHRRLEARIRAATELSRPERPHLLLMHGPSGSGKSWLSERLIAPLGAVRIRSDRERHRLAGASSREDRYSAAMSDRTYARLLEAARSCLAAGVNVLVDAAFLSSSRRRPFIRLAAEHHVPVTLIACTSAPSLMYERVRARGIEGRDPSEATAQVLSRKLATLAPLEEDELGCLITVDTSSPDADARAVNAIRSLRASHQST